MDPEKLLVFEKLLQAEEIGHNQLTNKKFNKFVQLREEYYKEPEITMNMREIMMKKELKTFKKKKRRRS